MAPGTPPPHDGVVYRSRNAVLVIGESAATVDAARELVKRAPKLRIALFVPGASALTDLPSNISAVGGRIDSLQGYLGKFSASVWVAVDKVEDAGIFSANADRYFDLVLDLRREPQFSQAVPPYGYFAPGSDAAALLRAFDSMAQLSGDFHKQKYFEYRPQLCTHGAKGVAGCTRCLSVCDAAAIRSVGEKIEVDPYLCQGCASCTLACPTGALSFSQPTPKTLERELNELLVASAPDADAHFLVVHDAASRHVLSAIDITGFHLLEVNPLAAFSDLLWLAALRGGMSGVVLVMAPATPPHGRKLIEQKLSELRAILVGIGRDPAMLQLTDPMKLAVTIDQLKRGAPPRAHAVAVTGNASDEKRVSFLAAVDAITRDGEVTGRLNAGVAEPVALAPGAGFGNVLVDTEKCTLCHACTHLCPTGALSGQMDPVPALFFTESLCVQCNLCRAGCPEKAITLQARFLPDAVQRGRSRELARDQLVPCNKCGTPFMGQRKLAASLALMQDFAKDMPGGIDSLRMCPSCRQRETMMG